MNLEGEKKILFFQDYVFLGFTFDKMGTDTIEVEKRIIPAKSQNSLTIYCGARKYENKNWKTIFAKK